MTTKAFNNYIEMYFDTHEEFPKNIKNLIDEQYSNGTFTTTISAQRISDSPNTILVSRHPKEANGRTTPHSHDYFELIYVSKGSCSQTIEGKKCDLKAGDFCLLNTSVSHTIDTDTDDTMLFNIMIKPSLFKESFFNMISVNDLISNFFASSLFMESSSNPYLYYPHQDNSNAAEFLHSLIIEEIEEKIGYEKAAENYLALFFTELTRNWQHKIDKDSLNDQGNNTLSEILAYINKNKHDITLSAVAEHFHYHPKYISSLIKKHTNKSFSEIVFEGRMWEVCSYLKNSALSIDEISRLCGFNDRSYFNKQFKKRYGMSPQAYRDSTGGE